MDAAGANLYPGERVLWTGAPTRYPVFNRADLFLIPFSLMWCGGVALTFVNGQREGEPAVFPMVVAAFFGLIGVHLLVGRLVLRWLSLRGTSYAVTDRRLVITTTALGQRRERSTYLKDLEPPVVSTPDAMTGTVAFGTLNLLSEALTEQLQVSTFGPVVLPFLVEVQNPRLVRDTIAAAQAAAGSSPAR